MIAFDTDVLTEILLGDPTFGARAVTISPHEQAVPVVVIEEICVGDAGHTRGRVLPRAYYLFEQTLQISNRLPYYRTRRQADTLYLQWRHQRIRVGTYDLRIAAICVAIEPH